MKRNIILVAAAVCVALSSCVKDKEQDFVEDQILFSASTGELETRTEYGAFGAYDNNNNPTLQHIDWKSTGDKITILMGSESADYDVTRVSQGSGASNKSNASISVTSGSEALRWGDGSSRTFYAMYPAAGTISYVNNNNNTTYQNGLDSDGNMTAVIPPSSSAAALATLPHGYMYATKTTGRQESVPLAFAHHFTAFSFTLKNTSTKSSLTLTSFKLKSENHSLSGVYTVSSTGAYSKNIEFSKEISVTGITVPKATDSPGEVSFTIVTFPSAFPGSGTDAFDDLTVECVCNEMTKTLPLQRDNAPISFAPLKKHNISITLPVFEYTYGFSVMNPTDLTSSADSYPAESNTASVTSWKSSDGGTTKIPVDWTVSGYYSDEQCTTAVSDNWITDFTPSGSGEVKSISINYYRAASTGSAAVTDITAQLRNSTFGAGSTSTNPYNLSNPSDMTSDFIVESANCYIVNGPGWYRIPLVMGNGVKGNVANTSAFQVSGYRDFNNNNLVSSSSVKLKDLTGNPDVQNPQIVWTDVDGLVSSTSLSVSSDDNWLIFEVPSSSIAQGNAVISVTNGTNIMWSYHIWVTNHTALDDFTVKRKQGSPAVSHPEESFTIMPYYLGWITTGGTLEKYGESTIFVKLEQTGTNSIAVMKVFRPSYIYHIGVPVGTCTNYQWGRKDPFVTGHFTMENTTGSLYQSIRKPSVFNNSGAFGNNYALWSTNYSSSTSRYTDVSKSIYDPCPAGYKLLECYAFGYSSWYNNFTYSTDDSSLTDGGGKSFYLPKAGYISSSGTASGTGEIFFGTAFCGGNSQYYTNHGGWSAQSSYITNCMPILPVKE